MPLQQTIDWLHAKSDRTGKDRTRRDPATGCLIWLGAVSCQIPKGHLAGSGSRAAINLRRLVLEAKMGRKLETTEIATYRCGNMLCLEHEHLYATSRKTIQQRSGLEGRFSTEARSAGARKSARAKLVKKFPIPHVRMILWRLHNGEFATHLGPELGHAPSTLQRIASWEIPELIGMDRAQEELRLRMGIAPDSKVRVIAPISPMTRNRWVPDAPPPLFSAVPLGGFATGARA
jgi:hypothetical protein